MSELEKKIKNQLSEYGCPDSFIENETNKWMALIKQERIRYGEWLLSSESDVRKAEPADEYERGYDYGYDEARAELRQRNKGELVESKKK